MAIFYYYYYYLLDRIETVVLPEKVKVENIAFSSLLMSCPLKRKPQNLVPKSNFNQLEPQFVFLNLKKSPIRKIKTPQEFYDTRYASSAARTAQLLSLLQINKFLICCIVILIAVADAKDPLFPEPNDNRNSQREGALLPLRSVTPLTASRN